MRRVLLCLMALLLVLTGLASAGAAELPEMKRIKLKAKKFTYYKLVLENDSADTTATVVSVDIRVRGTGYVR